MMTMAPRAHGLAEAAIDALSSNICVIDQDGVIIAVNRSWQNFSAENSLVPNRNDVGTHYLKICGSASGQGSDEADDFVQGVLSVLRGKSDRFQLEYPCHSPTEKRWFMASVTPLEMAGGGAVIAHSLITDRKLLEIERVLQQQALRTANERMSVATGSAGIGVWELDLATQKIAWNDQMYRLYQMPVGTEVDYAVFLNALHPDCRQIVADAVEDALVGRKAFDTEFKIVLADGSIRFLKANAQVMRDEAGSAIRMTGVNWDISERVLQAEELRAVHLRAEEALEAKGRFLAMMSHELRTPLNAVVGFSTFLLESNEAKTRDGERYLRNIEAASKTLLGIVNDVMIVSKSQAGAIELDPQPFRLADAIEETATMLRQQATVKGLEFKLVYDPMIPELVLGDDSRLKQVLLNLLSNAIKFTREGKVSLYVTLLKNEEQQADIRFVILDTGIGISEANQRKLFKRFSQVDQTISRQFGGSGLGLSICKDLLELMGSTIDVESQAGEGTKFTFDLSLPVTEGLPIRASESSETPETGKKLNILVAEDVEMNQELLETILTRQGHKVTIVGNGIEAVEAVKREHYDLVLMDVNMPLMDGLEATQHIRALGPHGQSLPIIALTANVLSSEVERFLAVGINAHVGKPFSPKELFAAIQKWGTPSLENKGDEVRDPVTSVAPILDEGTLEEMRELMGSLKTQSLLEKLKLQTFQSFQETGDRTRLCQQAHSLASSSGMLGFQRLSKACLRLENAMKASAAMDIRFENALGDAISAKHESLAVMQHQLANAI
jgi:signal transduction histidine kinase/CheY-like chemotaxis protein/HPt (histidine-containing phosphotransfer) domain-containing protein